MSEEEAAVADAEEEAEAEAKEPLPLLLPPREESRSVVFEASAVTASLTLVGALMTCVSLTLSLASTLPAA